MNREDYIEHAKVILAREGEISAREWINLIKEKLDLSEFDARDVFWEALDDSINFTPDNRVSMIDNRSIINEADRVSVKDEEGYLTDSTYVFVLNFTVRGSAVTEMLGVFTSVNEATNAILDDFAATRRVRDNAVFAYCYPNGNVSKKDTSWTVYDHTRERQVADYTIDRVPLNVRLK